jgi:hypothetical protein
MIPAMLAFAVFAGSAAFAEESKTAAPANSNTKQTTKMKKHHKKFSLKKSAKVNKENNNTNEKK